MKKYIFTILSVAVLMTTSCDDILDRPQLNTPTDGTFWKTEMDARLYANGFYRNYFVGYADGWATNYTPLRGMSFSDDLASTGQQSSFSNSIPTSLGSSNANDLATYQTQYVGPTWNFTWIRKANVFMERLEANMKGNVTEEAFNHWHAVAAFFKCFSYSRLVAVFGDVPYYETSFANSDLEAMYKDRDSRVFVMDKVHDMLKNEVLVNMRNKEAIMYRHYTFEMLKHHIASYSNGVESQAPAPNLALAKSFICQDGKVYQHSDIENAKLLSIANLAKTRDPRFEATFIDHVNTNSVTLLYASKFIEREALTMDNPKNNPIYDSNTNTNDAPVIRYAEVLLNWIEAKAELGGVTQTDIDNSINQLRRRPLDATAQAKGLKNTADMKLSDITTDFDPARDQDVDPLIWEIRRERRMELVYEHCRLHDIKRWKKLEYMNNSKYPDTMTGPWVDMPKEVPTYLDDQYIGKRQVKKEDGSIITFDGTNAADMVGYYLPTNALPRNTFSDRSYCSPVGEQEINTYAEKGFKLTQTKGW